MRCSKCRSDNPAAKKFCAACGTALVVLCAKCASENSASSQFCGDCGEALNASTVASSNEALAAQEVSDGERRQLTVMFCDLVDSTALSGQLDPEELREVIRTYQADSAAISSTTYRLVQGFFVCASMGSQILKGVVKPIEVYRVLGQSGAHSRFEVVTRAGLIPLVDREEEMALLGRCWERTKEGQGQVVLLSGEPGIGKSRLVQEIKEKVVREAGIQAEFRPSPYHENTAYYPIIVHLQRLLDLQTSDLPHQKLDKLERKLSEYGFALPEALPPFSALLSLPEPAGYPSLVNSPQRLRQKMLDLLMVWLLKESERRPVLTVWEKPP